MFNNSTLLEVLSNVFKSIEKDLKTFNYKKQLENKDINVLDTFDKSMALSLLANSLHSFVLMIPKVNLYNLEKLYRFNSKVEEKDNHRLITVSALVYKDQECVTFDGFSLIFTTFVDELESFKLEISDKQQDSEQKLNFRLMARNNGELTLEFFSNTKEKNEVIKSILAGISKVKEFEFNKQITFALGGVITQIKEL